MILGDDAISSRESDCFDYLKPASSLAEQLLTISKTSGVCCGILGPWGSGKSSFMHLVESFSKEKYKDKVLSAWFTAWDPGGIEDLEDSMLYSLYQQATKEEKELESNFTELKTALGLRKSSRDKAKKILSSVSEALSGTQIKPALDLINNFVPEYDSSGKVKSCFLKLMANLETEDRQILFFIDDIDRANGLQIKNILSALKTFVSHPRIVVILGYDEHYVLNALNPVLETGIDSKNYIEKIITISRKLPLPDAILLSKYASNLLESTVGLDKEISDRLGSIAVHLTESNPRRLKKLVLGFSNCLLPCDYKSLTDVELSNGLVFYGVSELGLLSENGVLDAFTIGKDEIWKVFEGLQKKRPELDEKIRGILRAIGSIQTDNLHIPTDLRRNLSVSYDLEFKKTGAPIIDSSFDWRDSFKSILEIAAVNGFRVREEINSYSYNLPPTEITVPPSSKLRKLEGGETIYEIETNSTRIQLIFSSLYKSGWNEYSQNSNQFLDNAIDRLFDNCSYLVRDKCFVLWLIDDANINSYRFGNWESDANGRSAGLKYPFVFCVTPKEKIQRLISTLLNLSL
jgi:hypothetical protein